jgi:hypothetical protein
LTSEQSRHLAQLLGGDLDWTLLLDLASTHGLRPLLFRHAFACAPASMPAGVESRLWVHKQQLRSKNETLASELSTILGLFYAADIQALPFKGPMLALQLYGDLGLREFGDLDLLVPRAQLQQAKALLATRGYAPMFRLSAAAEEAMLRSPVMYHVMLMRGEAQGLVELHWQTDAEFPIGRPSDPDWWSGLERTSFDGAEVPCLAPHELLFYLCLHGSKHHWTSLHWLADVAELIRQSPQLDWEWVLDRAGAWQAGTRVSLGLQLANEVLDAPLPEHVAHWIERFPRARVVGGAIRARWFQLPQAAREPFERLRLNFKLYDSASQRLRHVINRVLRPGLAEWSRWSLPSGLFILYVPLRLVRLIGKHATRGAYSPRGRQPS